MRVVNYRGINIGRIIFKGTTGRCQFQLVILNIIITVRYIETNTTA